MLQLLRWLNEKKKKKEKEFNHLFFSPLSSNTIVPDGNRPVSSPLKLLPTILKTGYLHLNTTPLKCGTPLPAQNDILVSQSIKKWVTPTWPYYYTH